MKYLYWHERTKEQGFLKAESLEEAKRKLIEHYGKEQQHISVTLYSRY